MKEKLGYFIIDNASFNNICITEIIETLQLDQDIYDKRLWCMGHIINFIAKKFLFSNKLEGFETDVVIAESKMIWKKL